MGLFEQINADIKTAMKAKEADKLGTLRAIKAQLLLIKTSAGGKEERHIRAENKKALRDGTDTLQCRRGRPGIARKRPA